MYYTTITIFKYKNISPCNYLDMVDKYLNYKIANKLLTASRNSFSKFENLE